MLAYILTFFASFSYVALKAGQQLNVVHNNYVAIIPTSLGMAAMEVLVVSNIVKVGWGWIVIIIGLGSGLGAIVAMLLHAELRRYKSGG